MAGLKWFQKLNTAYQVAVIGTFFFTLCTGSIATAVLFSVRVIKNIVQEQTAPIMEVSMYNLEKSGRLKEFLEMKEEQRRAKGVLRPTETTFYFSPKGAE